MYPAPFDYIRARSVEDALDALSAHDGEAKLLAGGQSLIPVLRFRLARPSMIVDLNGVDGLSAISVDDEWMEVGALVREAALTSDERFADWPILRDAGSHIADPLVRNRGTIGGNLAHGDPANDLPAVMIALDGEAVIRSREGLRTVPMGAFFVGPMETALGPTEILTAIRIPRPPRPGSAYVKIERQAGDYAVVGAAVRVEADGDRIIDARVVLTNAGLTAVRCPAAEELLRGREAERTLFSETGAAAAEAASFWDDLRGSVAYKRSVARLATAMALELAFARLDGSAA